MKTEKTKILNRVIFLIILLFSTSYSQEFSKVGTGGFTFLEIPVFARTSALGEASIALNDLNSSALFINPGVLDFTNLNHSISSSYSSWIADIKHFSTAYSFKSGLGTFALGAVVLDYGTMPRTIVARGSKLFESVGTFSANSIVLSGAYSKRLTDKFSFGVALKYVREKIDIYSADNILFDGGIIYFTGLGSLRIAAAIQNFGVNSKFIKYEFKMPAIFRLGLAAEVLGGFESDYRVTLIAEAIHPTDSDEKINSGVEIAWNELIVFRGGYKFFYDEETFSLGVGFNPNFTFPMNLDFSYSDYGRLGDILRFSMQLGIL
jgi:hypothetical protein